MALPSTLTVRRDLLSHSVRECCPAVPDIADVREDHFAGSRRHDGGLDHLHALLSGDAARSWRAPWRWIRSIFGSRQWDDLPLASPSSIASGAVS